MATIDLGKIRFNWQGAYNNSTAYVVNDVVSSSGNSYICKLASTGNAVSNGTYWDLMSQAGIDGTDLSSTLTTQGDIVVKGASALERLAKGTASQQLRMNSGATGLEYFTPSSAGFTEGTTQATTSGTTKDFTGIPTGTTFIAIGFDNTGVNNTDGLLVQLGDAGGFETSGYDANSILVSNGTNPVSAGWSDGFPIKFHSTSNGARGTMILVRTSGSTHSWSASACTRQDSGGISIGGAEKSLSAELTQIRIKAQGTFNSGAVNIIYQ